MPDQIRAIFDSLKIFWIQLVQFLPQLLIGSILFLSGWFIARILRKGLVKLFKLIRLDAVAEKAGIENFLIKGGAQYTTIYLLANFIYWFLMFSLTMAVLHSLGLDAAKQLYNSILSYIPNVIVAVLVLIVGSLWAKLIRGVLSTYLSNIRISGAEFIGNIVYWALILLVVSVTLQQLSIGGQVLISAFEIAFAGLCLALAIAFGSAGKEWATQILDKLWRNSR
jgi:hypothetical protein